MNIIRVILILVFAFTLSANDAFASRIVRANKALVIHDYFKAKKLFIKGKKYNISPASYGLATIYSRDNNPFFNLDSAYQYVLLADSTWESSSDRKKSKWAIYSWTAEGIDSLKHNISDQLFEKAKESHNVEAYADFVNRNPWSKHYDLAIHKRDSLAFFEVVQNNNAVSYRRFLNSYPSSEYAELAQENYHHSQFMEMTLDGELESYKTFVKEYPNSPQRVEADSLIYCIVTEANTEEAFSDFVLNYFENTFIRKGWDHFYQVYLFDYTKSRILEFKNNYPQALNILDIEKDIASFSKEYLPYKKAGKYGVMNGAGEGVIDATYEFLGPFKDGLAQYFENDVVGLINLRGDVVVSAEYDNISEISNGRFIVENNDFLGLIDRNGKVLLPCEYDDIGDLSEDWIYISKNDKYSYADYNGEVNDSSTFLEATDFKNGYAIIENETGAGIINNSLEYVVSPIFNELKWLSDSLLSFSEGTELGVINIQGDTIVNQGFDYIGKFHDNLALVSINDTVRYINKSGDVVIDNNYKVFPNYKSKGDFVNGAAIVVQDGLYGRVNAAGDLVSELNYDNISVHAKCIPFEMENVWGIMSLTNKVLVSPKYEAIDVVGEKFGVTRFEDSVGVVDLSGSEIISNSYHSIEFLEGDVFKVFDGEKFGLNIDGTFVLPFEYNAISLFNDRFVTLVNGVTISYYDIVEKRIIKLIEESE